MRYPDNSRALSGLDDWLHPPDPFEPTETDIEGFREWLEETFVKGGLSQLAAREIVKPLTHDQLVTIAELDDYDWQEWSDE